MKRGVSTVVGALISLAAIMAAVAGVAYYLSSLTSVEVNAAKLASQRLNEWLYMYNSVVVSGNDTTVCFHDDTTGMLSRVILVHDDRIEAVEAENGTACIPRASLRDADQLVLASRHGALLPVPLDPVENLEGTSTISELLSLNTGEETEAGIPLAALQSRVTTSSSPLLSFSLAQLSYIDGRVLHVRLAINNSIVDVNTTPLDVLITSVETVYSLYSASSAGVWQQEFADTQALLPGDYRVGNEIDELSESSAQTLAAYSTALDADLSTWPGVTLKLSLVDNDTLCGVVLYSDALSIGLDANKLVGVASCISRRVLEGGDIVVDSTLAWLPDTPLSKTLLEKIEAGQPFTLYAGPVSGSLPYGLVPLDNVYGDEVSLEEYEDFFNTIVARIMVSLYEAGLEQNPVRVWQLPFGDTEGKVALKAESLPALPLAPVYVHAAGYTILRPLYQLPPTISDYYAVETGRAWTSYVEPVEPLPYARVVLTPLAYAYQANTGMLPQFYLTAWRTVLYRVDPAGRIDLYLPVGYVPMFITYVDASQANCTLEYTGKPVVKVFDERSSLVEVDGMVCVKIGEYNASIDYIAPIASVTFETDASNDITVERATRPLYIPVYRVELPGDLVACIPGARLVCSGRLYEYYSFAPSVLYEPSVVERLNEILSSYLHPVALLITAHRGTDRISLMPIDFWRLIISETCGVTTSIYTVTTRGILVDTERVECSSAMPPRVAVSAILVPYTDVNQYFETYGSSGSGGSSIITS